MHGKIGELRHPDLVASEQRADEQPRGYSAHVATSRDPPPLTDVIPCSRCEFPCGQPVRVTSGQLPGCRWRLASRSKLSTVNTDQPTTASPATGCARSAPWTPGGRRRGERQAQDQTCRKPRLTWSGYGSRAFWRTVKHRRDPPPTHGGAAPTHGGAGRTGDGGTWPEPSPCCARSRCPANERG
jgi:hypothetical protein